MSLESVISNLVLVVTVLSSIVAFLGFMYIADNFTGLTKLEPIKVESELKR